MSNHLYLKRNFLKWSWEMVFLCCSGWRELFKVIRICTMHYAGNLVDRRKCWILQIRGGGCCGKRFTTWDDLCPCLATCLPYFTCSLYHTCTHHITLVHTSLHLYTSYHTCTHYTALVHIIPSLRAPCHIYFVHIMHRSCAHHSNQLQISSALEQATLGKCTHAFLCKVSLHCVQCRVNLTTTTTNLDKLVIQYQLDVDHIGYRIAFL